MIGAWLDAMIRQYGVQLLFTVARGIGYVLSILMTIFIVNKWRDRDERRNVDEKARRIIATRTAERDDWKQRCKDAERLAGRRLGSMRAALTELSNASVQLVGAGDDEPVTLRKVKG